MDNPDHLQTQDGVPLNLRFPMPEDNPTRERWFWGSISGQDAEDVLRKPEVKEGSFLVRDSRSEPGWSLLLFARFLEIDTLRKIKSYRKIH